MEDKLEENENKTTLNKDQNTRHQLEDMLWPTGLECSDK